MVRTTLKIEMPQVDIDEDGSGENAVFEIESWTLTQRLRTGFLVGENPSGFRQTITDKVTKDEISGVSQYRDVHINEGTGNRIFDFSFVARDGHKTPTWGDDSASEDRGTVANATGQGIFERMQVMERYFAAVSEDSRNPITLRIGGYDDNELFDGSSPDDDESKLNENKLNVVAENPEFTYNPRGEDGQSSFRGEITFIETVTSDALISAVEQTIRDGV